MDSRAEPALELRGVARHYRQGGQVLEVLRGVDLQVARGETVALTGPSGSGKSTLLQVAGLLDSADGGTVRVGGVDASSADDSTRTALRRDRVGFVYQFHHLLPELTALENVIVPQLIAGQSPRRASRRAGALLGQVGLAGRERHRPGELSGGEQLRVAICRAVANRPGILLADEPTGDLDANTSSEVLDVLLALSGSEGLAILAASHDPELASRMDRRFGLRDGKLEPLPDPSDKSGGASVGSSVIA